MLYICLRDNENRTGYKELIAGSGVSIVENPTTVTVSATGGGGGADVKSGSLVPTAKTWVAVTFNTAFSSTPAVTGAISKNAAWRLRNVSTTGFEVYLNTTGSNTFWWIASDAGNP